MRNGDKWRLVSQSIYFYYAKKIMNTESRSMRSVVLKNMTVVTFNAMIFFICDGIGISPASKCTIGEFFDFFVFVCCVVVIRHVPPI